MFPTIADLDAVFLYNEIITLIMIIF